MTRNQCSRKYYYKFSSKRQFNWLPLNGGPHRKSIAIKIGTRKPKKPNSANRPIVGALLKRGQLFYVHIAGEGGHTLQKFSTFLSQGARVRDVPQVHYRGIRGIMDLRYVVARITSRSKYGRKNPIRRIILKTHTKKKTIRRDKQIAASAAKLALKNA